MKKPCLAIRYLEKNDNELNFEYSINLKFHKRCTVGQRDFCKEMQGILFRLHCSIEIPNFSALPNSIFSPLPIPYHR